MKYRLLWNQVYPYLSILSILNVAPKLLLMVTMAVWMIMCTVIWLILHVVIVLLILLLLHLTV